MFKSHLARHLFATKERYELNLHKLDSESEEQYIWRLGQAKDTGQLDMNWNELTDIINRELGYEDKPFSEAAFRKPYQQAKRYFEAGVFNDLGGKEYLRELQSKKQELTKEQVKVRDERNELNRVLREEARKESYRDQILRSIKEHHFAPLLYDDNKCCGIVPDQNNDLIVSMTDLHTGIEINNAFNKFNESILKDRLNQYLNKIFEVQNRHNSENVYVILSELVSGIIHLGLRIENNQNLIEQFLTATDYISQFLAELSYRFNNVSVYVCMGNHSRISPKKDDSLKGENMDLLAIPFLSAKLQNFKNIEFNQNMVEKSIAIFNVRGNTVMSSHGDKDDPRTVVQKFTMLFGTCPDLVYLGHRHTNGLSTVYNTKVIQSGCMSGTDEYALDLRLHSKPSQTISVVTKDGLDCLYDVVFN